MIRSSQDSTVTAPVCGDVTATFAPSALRGAHDGASCRHVWAAVVLAAPASPVQAQETGTVRGTVTLVENGGLVDGAVILLLGTGAFTFTENGAFEFTNVPVGSYLVTAQRERLTAGSRTVTITAGETVTADFELSLAPVREEVTVTAPAVGAAATLQAFNTVTTVNSFEIAREAPSTIGEALEHEPGIANRSFGPGASRPVIRGFGGDRAPGSPAPGTPPSAPRRVASLPARDQVVQMRPALSSAPDTLPSTRRSSAIGRVGATRCSASESSDRERRAARWRANVGCRLRNEEPEASHELQVDGPAVPGTPGGGRPAARGGGGVAKRRGGEPQPRVGIAGDGPRVRQSSCRHGPVSPPGYGQG